MKLVDSNYVHALRYPPGPGQITRAEYPVACYVLSLIATLSRKVF